MKKFVVSMLIVAGLFAATGSAFAISANAYATIVSAIAVSGGDDSASGDSLRFGSLVAGTGGTAVVSAASVRSVTGGVSEVTSTVSAASFTVTGESGSTYSITLPATAQTLSLDGDATKTMSVSDFTSASANNLTLVSGSDTFSVGATLTVGNAQAVGTYSGTFEVTVSY